MKNIFFVTAMLLVSQASLACLGEAQIRAEVQMVQPNGQTCLVAVSPNSISLYSVNQTCPLSQEEVLSTYVNVPARSNGDCGIHPGGTISGVIVKDASGALTLE